jgi:RNA polymerase sigma-70 factor (ECF subfamily)
MTDEMIIRLYFARKETAVSETTKKYGGLCTSLARSILPCKEDAEECFSDACLRLWNTIPPQKPAHLGAYLAKITRNLAFSRWRKLTAAKRGGGETELVLEELAGCVPGKEKVDDRLNAKELAKAIRAFLDTLPDREQDIFLRRYFYVEDPQTVAQRHKIRRSNVNLILSRTRAKLKAYLTQEGYNL